ncbi:hypothetical protein POM88_053570 [Heracleum sosnowskyi]|uniref:At2g35280-like TPR domain-containing protein n=1 Tax=Heracleum sosnowskyi TaxID=360622 RepID=A0AAD8LX26_9APIA|nr:hypothetical protein POM88_053570 [Heracleum sosnowskyi]
MFHQDSEIEEDKSIFDILPLEVVKIHIVARAAASSSDNLFYLSQCCKTLHEISNDPSVLKRVSLDKFYPVAWKQEEKNFLQRCTNAENPEALYRTGMSQYFGIVDGGTGMQNLETAMNSGHLGGKYALGIILLLQGGVYKLDGMEMILSMKKTSTATDLEEIRKSFLGIIKGLWIRNTMIVRQKMPQCCTKHPTDSAGWDGVKEVDLQCEDCSCDQELVHLWKVLPNPI